MMIAFPLMFIFSPTKGKELQIGSAELRIENHNLHNLFNKKLDFGLFYSWIKDSSLTFSDSFFLFGTKINFLFFQLEQNCLNNL